MTHYPFEALKQHNPPHCLISTLPSNTAHRPWPQNHSRSPTQSSIQTFPTQKSKLPAHLGYLHKLQCTLTSTREDPLRDFKVQRSRLAHHLDQHLEYTRRVRSYCRLVSRSTVCPEQGAMGCKFDFRWVGCIFWWLWVWRVGWEGGRGHSGLWHSLRRMLGGGWRWRWWVGSWG